MKESFRNADGYPVLMKMVSAIQENKVYLGDVDGLIGDGDHGMNMNKGFTIFGERIEGKQIAFSEGLSELGNVLLTEIGGSMGPIYGTIFIAMGDSLDGLETIDRESLAKALQDAGLTVNDINRVIMVGGSTRIPSVCEAVKQLIGKEPYKGINPDECVAIGAAIQAGVLGGEVKNVLLLDVTPLSLGIETLGGVFTKLIERNTTIPTSKSQVFSTAADNQTSVDIHVLQGEREMARDNKTLGSFSLTGIPPARRGIPQIEVKFDIDANGIVHVTATDLGTKKEQSVTITSSTNLSEADIDKAIKDAEKYAEEDKKRKEEVDAKNGLDQMIFTIENFLSENGDKVDASDKATLEEEVKKAKDVLASGDIENIKKTTDDLAKVSSGIFQKMYAAASQQAQSQEQPQQNGGNGDDNIDFDVKDAK